MVKLAIVTLPIALPAFVALIVIGMAGCAIWRTAEVLALAATIAARQSARLGRHSARLWLAVSAELVLCHRAWSETRKRRRRAGYATLDP